MPFVGEADGDTVRGKRPYFFDEAVIKFTVPFAGQELDDLFTPGNEFDTIAPFAIGRACRRGKRAADRASSNRLQRPVLCERQFLR